MADFVHINDRQVLQRSKIDANKATRNVVAHAHHHGRECAAGSFRRGKSSLLPINTAMGMAVLAAADLPRHSSGQGEAPLAADDHIRRSSQSTPEGRCEQKLRVRIDTYLIGISTS
jgi:hypothetical protein